MKNICSKNVHFIQFKRFDWLIIVQHIRMLKISVVLIYALVSILYLISGQSYKHFTLVNYDSRVIRDFKIPHILTVES